MSSRTTDPGPPARFDRFRNRVFSRKGGWFPGRGVFSHGYEMMRDLVGRASYMQVVALNATGRLPARPLADWLEALYICLSWPDPRIWCNQVGAFGGTTRSSPVAATCCGVMAADSRAFGIRPVTDGVAFIQRAMAGREAGLTAAAIVERECARHGGRPYIMGYARPLAKGDERIEAMERTAAGLGFGTGPHLALAYEVEAVLQERFGEGMNINGYLSAFLSDQGYTPEEVYRLLATLVASGVTACYVDVRDRAPDTFLPLRCDDVEYTGPPPRPLPE